MKYYLSECAFAFFVGFIIGLITSVATCASSQIRFGQTRGRCLQACYDTHTSTTVEVDSHDVCWCLIGETKVKMDLKKTDGIAP